MKVSRGKHTVFSFTLIYLIYLITLIYNTSDTRCVGFFPYQPILQHHDVLRFHSILTLTLWVPQVKGSVPQDSDAPPFRCHLQVVGPQVTHSFCANWLHIGGSHEPLLGFSHWLEQLTKPRRTVYLLLLIYLLSRKV